MSDIYHDLSYGQDDLGFAGKPGILVVDFQRGFVDEIFPMGGAQLIERGVKNTARLLEVGRSANIPVVSC